MPVIAANVKAIMREEYRIPTVTAYNRLEPSQRTKNFDRSLKAEIRDALWMLTRQWQFGEFEGEDAGSPVTAQVLGEHSSPDRIGFPGGKVFSYDQSIPLETKVEREPIRRSLFFSVQLSRYFFKCVNKQGLLTAVNKTALITKYPLNYLINELGNVFSIDPNDADGVQLFNAVSGKMPDGFSIHVDIITPNGAITNFEQWLIDQGFSSADQGKFKQAATDFENWFTRNYSQPADPNDTCWLPSQLEYQFSIATPFALQQQKTLVADQYSQGHLDWYSFDLDTTKRLVLDSEPADNPASIVENYVSFIPAPVSFKGMPNPRFWMMENSQTDFGKIDTSPTGLLHLLLAEFGLIYSNDWFMLPYPLSINTIADIGNMVITDVFGQHILIRPAGRGADSDWQRWAMFRQTDRNDSSFNSNIFYLAPALSQTLEGDPTEEINFLRDEMANMVWAVETIVPSQAGRGVNGNEMALRELILPDTTPANDTVQIRYVLGTTVPNNWIPFVPVHMPASDSEIRLQRAQMPGAKGASTVLLTEVPPPYFINEEEVPRSGILVQQSFQQARWLGGKNYLWIGRNKETGKGEGWSNLKFDQIEDITIGK